MVISRAVSLLKALGGLIEVMAAEALGATSTPATTAAVVARPATASSRRGVEFTGAPVSGGPPHTSRAWGLHREGRWPGPAVAQRTVVRRTGEVPPALVTSVEVRAVNSKVPVPLNVRTTL